MSADAQKARSLFLAAVEDIAPDRWEAFLDEACAQDQELRRRVEALLRAHQVSNSLFDSPAPAVIATVDAPITERPGTVIGPYKLMEQIGEGGMGLVFVAEQQQPVRRKVALKVIKPGMDTRQVVARFEAERQALALMDHPHIAKVYDGGQTDSGRPYFVMELVKGVPITEYCDQNQVPVRERLELFRQVCQAVQHAHQKGIIHRDIKPSNVLVASHDGVPVIKIIDFGVAKAVGQQLTERTLYTQFTQLIGTPLYMSPEQAGQSALDVDTRSDIYSLGVLLYELLTGTTPLDKERLREVDFDEIRRIIREEEPARPSTRISTLGQAATTVSANRKSEPKQLSRLCRGELDWIVMKALEKDRNRRYETANGLARDIERYLADEPVHACPPSAWYRASKFARRHRVGLAAAMLVAAALVTALAGLAAGELRVREEQEARLEAARGEADALHAKAEAEKRRADGEAERVRALEQEKNALKRWRRTAYYRQIALTSADYFANEVARAKDRLADSPVDLRGWEWDYLTRLCNSELSTVATWSPELAGPSVALSGDGKRVAVLDRSVQLHVSDAATGRDLFHFRAKDALVRSPMAFSADGARLAIAGLQWIQKSSRVIVRLHEAATGTELEVLSGFNKAGFREIVDLAFSPDGNLLAATDSRGHLIFCEVASGKILTQLDAAPFPGAKPNQNWRTQLAFNRAGGRLATATVDPMPVKVWEVPSGKLINTLDPPNGYSGVAISPNGAWVAAAGRALREPELWVRVWDTQSGQTRHMLRGHTAPVGCLAFSPDEKRLAAGCGDGTVRLWDIETGREFAVYRGHAAAVVRVTFSADGKRLVSLSDNGVVKTWDATRSPEALALKCKSPQHAALSPDGRHLAIVTVHPSTKEFMTVVHDAASGKEEQVFGEKFEMPEHLAYAPDGRHIAAAVSGDQEGWVRVWDVTDGKGHRRLPDAKQRNVGPCFVVAYSPDGKLLAAGGGDRLVHVWDTASGVQKFQLTGHARSVSDLAFSGDGRRLASATGGITMGRPFGKNPLKLQGDLPTSPRDLRVWDMQTGQELLRLPLKHRPPGLAFSPDGNTVAVTGMDRLVRLYAVPSGKETLVLRGHVQPPWSVAFSPDGKRLVTGGGRDQSIMLWDTQTGEEILTINHACGHVASVAFSKDGTKIVASPKGGDDVVKLWDAVPRTKLPAR